MVSTEPNRARYIALEGIEGAGKSTVAGALIERLEGTGIPVIGVREPGGTPSGERIREILLDGRTHLEPWAEALLFAAARSELAAEVVGPALASGSWVVSDRSVYSSLAYQGGARGLGIEAVRRVNAAGLGDVWPDTVVLLRVRATTGLERQDHADRIGAEGAEFQSRVAAAFDEIAGAETDRFISVDAGLPFADVVDTVVARLGVQP